MQTRQQSLILLLMAGTLFSSCFHKSPTTGTADDIKQSFVCHTARGDYLVTHETIFQATSKSSGPKGNYTSGYTDARFTVRDLHTGVQVTRLVMGDAEDDVLPLGFDGKLLWCYSADKKTGLHAREPVSMQVAVTHEQIEAANPSLAGQINMPKITDADQSFKYDPVSGGIMITDMQGNLFLMDPATLKATPIKKEPAYSNHFSDAEKTSAYRVSGKHISLLGSPRNQIALGDNYSQDNIADPTYLSGGILLEQNTDHLAAIAAGLTAKIKNEFRQIRQEHDSLLAKYPVLTDERNAYLAIKDYHLIERYKTLDEKIKDHVRDSGYVYADLTRSLTEMALGGDSNTVYIIHANNLSDTSSTLISKVNIAGITLTTQWTTLIPQVYFDPRKGIKKNPMADVFKKGNPDFDYESFAVEGKVLTGIKMLFAFGINTDTGKLLWKVQL